MARGTNLTQLLIMLRAEAGHSTSVAAGADNEAALIQKLRRTQNLLYKKYDWDFMKIEEPIAMQSGERYYDWPADINFEETIEVWLDYGARPSLLTRGIGVQQYASTNSNAVPPERNSPVRRWDAKRPDPDKEQMEVWPIPADNSCTVWVFGKRSLRPLAAASDVADLDDDLIVLHCAAEILARAKSADAQLVAKAASDHLNTLKMNVKAGGRMINMAGPNQQPGMRPPRILISSSTN